MSDRTFSVSYFSACAYAAWVLVVALVATFCLVGALQYGILACASSALAATLSIRGFCAQVGANLHAAFELGRDAGRAEVRPLR